MCAEMAATTQTCLLHWQKTFGHASPYGLKRLGIENAPPFFTHGIFIDVQCPTSVEETQLSDLKACLERQGVAENVIRLGDAVFVRTGHGRRDSTPRQACSTNWCVRSLFHGWQLVAREKL